MTMSVSITISVFLACDVVSHRCSELSLSLSPSERHSPF